MIVIGLLTSAAAVFVLDQRTRAAGVRRPGRGAVAAFIDLRARRVFNLADLAVSAGVVLALCSMR